MPPPDPQNPATPRRLRVVVQQPALAKYRIPVFRELARRPGIDLLVSYATSPDLPNAEPDGFAAVPSRERILPLGPRSLHWDPAQWRYASREHADVLILTGNIQYPSLTAGILRARAAGVRVLLWTHGYSKNERPWRRAIRDRVYGLADGLILYGHRPAKRYLDEGWEKERVFVALNAIDQEPIQAARRDWLARPHDLEAFRREHRLGDGPVVLFVSRLDASRRVDLLIEAMARLKNRYPTLRANIVGKGDDEVARLTPIARDRQVADRLHFAGAVYAEGELAPWFLTADLFCFPTNIGLSMHHAFGYGLPVITSDNIESQAPEIEAVENGVNGLLYRYDDAGALAGAIDSLLSDELLCRRMAAAAHATATGRFTLPNMVDGLERAIRSALPT